MDLEENSKCRPELVEGEEGNLTPQALSTSKEIRAIINGDICPEENLKLESSVESGVADRFGEVEGDGFPAETIGFPQAVEAQIWDGIGVNKAENTSPRSSQSPSSSVIADETKPALTKGYVPRFWRRIRRDSGKNGASITDSAQFLKRRHSITESPVTREENKLKSMVEAEAEDSVTSAESRNAGMTSLPIGMGVLDQELEVLASRGFSIGMDSDNSEDHSSKLSMVSIAQKLRHDAHGFGRKRGRVKNLGGRGSSQVLQQRGQWRGGAVDASKKFQEDKVRLENENSHSSVESDLRSSAAGALQQGSVVSSNGIHSDRSLTFGGVHSDEAQSGGEIRPGYYKENGGMKILTREILNDKMLEDDARGRENFRLPSDLDPFMESIMLLQEAKESLENEILEIGVIGKEPVFEDTDSQLDGTEASNSPRVDAYLKKMHRRMEHQEPKLEEASATIKDEETTVLELEAVLSKARLPSMEVGSTDHLFLQEHQEEMESQLEALVKKTMEAEIEYLILAITSQNWKILAEDLIVLLKEQRSLNTDREQMVLNYRNFEERIFKLKDELCEGLLGTEKVLMLQSKVCKFSLCYFVQLLLFCIAFWSFLMQLSPQPNESFVAT